MSFSHSSASACQKTCFWWLKHYERIFGRKWSFCKMSLFVSRFHAISFDAWWNLFQLKKGHIQRCLYWKKIKFKATRPFSQLIATRRITPLMISALSMSPEWFYSLFQWDESFLEDFYGWALLIKHRMKRRNLKAFRKFPKVSIVLLFNESFLKLK